MRLSVNFVFSNRKCPKSCLVVNMFSSFYCFRRLEVQYMWLVSSKGNCITYEISFICSVLNCPFSDNCSASPKRKPGNILEKSMSSLPQYVRMHFYFRLSALSFTPTIVKSISALVKFAPTHLYLVNTIVKARSGRGSCR